MDLILKNIKELATPKGTRAKKGNEQGDVTIINNAMIGIKDGKIAYVGKSDDSFDSVAEKIIDCSNNLVTPGLVDCHTHLVFGGFRQNELQLKLDGYSYLDILKQGGGILSTVESTRNATEDELIKKTKNILETMLAHGTTTVEAKSGYGLNTETELKQIRVADYLNNLKIIDIVGTFMGAHAIPKEFKDDKKGYINYLINEMLPKISKYKFVEFCDIFCEKEIFTPEESIEILSKAKELGFKLKLHGDEIESYNGAETASKMKCISAEHLIEASDDGIKQMAENDVIAVLLPTTSFYLDKKFARARFMCENNVAIAIGSDFNPGSSPNLNLQLSMNMACLKYKLTPKEVLTAVTLNAAAAINKSESVGSIEVGKKADIIIWDAPDLNFIFYRFGNNLVSKVIKDGIVK